MRIAGQQRCQTLLETPWKPDTIDRIPWNRTLPSRRGMDPTSAVELKPPSRSGSCGLAPGKVTSRSFSSTL
ncbi:hypothetical protein GOP47_0020137 [Adiantum capillus-veneris]|uniref:Uncharacterized protein n=1 Tax=Adiantum capillus-veneris TaxID=13818 RepID=A0A9D4UD31_ADICA|nr:hypothetical protein GOP47_0020137 [Adiantum capillus-veneris]